MILNQEGGAKSWTKPKAKPKAKPKPKKKVVSKPSVVRKPIKLPKPKLKTPKKTTAWDEKKKIEKKAGEVSRSTKPGKTPAKGNPNPNGWKHAPADIGPTGKGKTTKKPAAKKVVKKPSSGTSSVKKPSSSSSSKSPSSSSSNKPSTKTTTKTPAAGTTANKTLSYLDKLWLEANGYKTQINNKMKAGFKYDPTKDASYAALKATAQTQAEGAKKDALETMNDRGIINSTVTGDRMGQIQQTAMDTVTAQIPQLEQQAYSRYQGELDGLFKLWDTTIGRAQDERNFGEDKRRWTAEFDQRLKEFETSKYQWDKEFDYNASQDAVDNAQAARNSDIAESNLKLSELKFAQTLNGEKDKKATQAALTELLGYKTADDAVNALANNAMAYYNGNVDLASLLNSLGKRWGAAFTTKAESANISFPSN